MIPLPEDTRAKSTSPHKLIFLMNSQLPSGNFKIIITAGIENLRKNECEWKVASKLNK